VATSLGAVFQAADTDMGPVYGGVNAGIGAYTLTGIYPRPIHHRRPASGRELAVVRANNGLVVAFNPFDERVWIMQNRKWRTATIPTAAAGGTSNACRFPVADPAGFGAEDGRLWFLRVLDNGATSLGYIDAFHTHPIPERTADNHDTGPALTATVRLAEHRVRNGVPIRPMRAFFEVSLDPSDTTGIEGQIGIRARVVTRARRELGVQEASSSVSSWLEQSWSAAQVPDNDTRVTVQMDLDDGGECLGLIPEIELSGLKLRRCIIVAQENP
jgi:hypothetical protein